MVTGLQILFGWVGHVKFLGLTSRQKSTTAIHCELSRIQNAVCPEWMRAMYSSSRAGPIVTMLWRRSSISHPASPDWPSSSFFHLHPQIPEKRPGGQVEPPGSTESSLQNFQVDTIPGALKGWCQDPSLLPFLPFLSKLFGFVLLQRKHRGRGRWEQLPKADVFLLVFLSLCRRNWSKVVDETMSVLLGVTGVCVCFLTLPAWYDLSVKIKGRFQSAWTRQWGMGDSDSDSDASWYIYIYTCKFTYIYMFYIYAHNYTYIHMSCVN